MALLLEGDVNDIGHNYMINQGSALTEKNLEFLGAKVVSHQVSYNDVVKTATDLIQKNGHNFIVTSSEIHIAPIFEVAKQFKNIYFLVYTGASSSFNRKDIPEGTRISTYSYDIVSCYYILGYIAGVFNNRVGMVVPGPPVENYWTVNSFFVGLRTANPEALLFVVSTGSFNDHDTAEGAAHMLLDAEVDIVTQSQADMFVSSIFLNNSKRALGSDGFKQSSIYGNKIIQSAVTQFENAFTAVGSTIKNNNWGSLLNYFGTWNNTFYVLDEYSFTVDQPERDKIDAFVKEFSKSHTYDNINNQPYLTNKLVTDMYGSLTYLEVFTNSTKMLDGIEDLGYYKVPLKEVYETKNINNAFFAVAILEIYNIQIKYSSIPFLFGLLLGASLVALAILLWNLRNLNRQICVAKIWMASLGYNLLIGLVIIKNTRIYFKFKDMIAKKQDKISPIPPLQVYIGFLPLLVIDIILLAILTGIGGINNWNSLGLDGIGKYEYTQTCTNNKNGDNMIYTLLVFHGVQLLYGCFISWKTRVIDLEEYVETHDFSTITYLISFCCFIIIPLMAGITSERNRNTIISACAIFTSFSAIIIIFGSKFWKIYKPIEDDGLPQIKLPPKKNGSSGKSSSAGKSQFTAAAVTKDPFATTTQSALKSLNMQNFVNPIESQSRAAAASLADETPKPEPTPTQTTNNDVVGESLNNNNNDNAPKTNPNNNFELSSSDSDSSDLDLN
eukprot:gene2149-2648_t